MKTYKVTVNGTVYDVAVEEVSNEERNTPAEPVRTAMQAQTQPASKTPVRKTETAGTPITAPMPGKILDVKVSAGASVKRGQVIMILEAMKMENEIVAPEDGVIADIAVSPGTAVEAGDRLAGLN